MVSLGPGQASEVEMKACPGPNGVYEDCTFSVIHTAVVAVQNVGIN